MAVRPDTLQISAHRFLHFPFIQGYANENTVFGFYNGRPYPWFLDADPWDEYDHLCSCSMMYDVPEKPLEIIGPDATAFLSYVLTRDVSKLAVGRAGYGLACDRAGGLLMDGVLIRHAADHFWYIQAEGEFLLWLEAQSEGFDVTVRDPKIWAIQIQGPSSLAVLDAAIDEPLGRFRYFDAAATSIGGQQLWVSRTGWSGELGFEIYISIDGTDSMALWNHLLEKGKPFGLDIGGLASLTIRRIEGGILDYGTDMDRSMTPFAAGLAAFVDLDRDNFIGRDALIAADRTPRLFGLIVEGGTPRRGDLVTVDDMVVGHITCATFSPVLAKGIGYVRFDQVGVWDQADLKVVCDDAIHEATLTALPFTDKERLRPRTIPEEFMPTRLGPV